MWILKVVLVVLIATSPTFGYNFSVAPTGQDPQPLTNLLKTLFNNANDSFMFIGIFDLQTDFAKDVVSDTFANCSNNIQLLVLPYVHPIYTYFGEDILWDLEYMLVFLPPEVSIFNLFASPNLMTTFNLLFIIKAPRPLVFTVPGLFRPS